MMLTALFNLVDIPLWLASASAGAGIILVALAISRLRASEGAVQANSQDLVQQPETLQEPALISSPSSSSDLPDNPQAEQRRYFVGKGVFEPERSDGSQAKREQTSVELKSIFPDLSLR
jgi:hypothetical protein